MKKSGMALAMLFALLQSTAAQATTELVSNGGFETGDFAGWAQSGNTGFSGVSTGVAHSGSYGAFFGPVGSDGFITEALATVAGGLYNISFWLLNEGGSVNHFGLTFGATNLVASTNGPAFGYTQFTFNNVLASGGDVLSFSFRNDPAFIYLDDVSVTAANAGPSAVPLPAGMPLLVAGLGALGLFGRKAKKKSA